MFLFLAVIRMDGCPTFKWTRSTELTLPLIIYCCSYRCVFFVQFLRPYGAEGVWPQHVHDDLLKRTTPERRLKSHPLCTPDPWASRWRPLPLLADHGVSQAFLHTSGRVEGKKGPSDHLPPVSATMGSVLPECAEGRLAFVPIRPGGGAAKALCPV